MSKFAHIGETVPKPHWVLGTPLRPFCLGYRFLFATLGLPFYGQPQAEATDTELLTAVCLCARSYQDTLGAILDGTWSQTFARWTNALRGPWWKRRRPDMSLARSVFRDYLTDGDRMPPVWRYAGTGSGGITFSSPGDELLRVRLIRSGFPPDYVMSHYLPALWYDYYTLRELDQLTDYKDAKLAGAKDVPWHKVFITATEVEKMSK